MAIEKVIRKLLSKEADVISLGQEGYDDAIKRWAKTAEKKAGFVVLPASADDVSQIVRWCTGHNIPFAVAGGFHSCSGVSSIEGGISINLSKMRDVSADRETMRVTCQGGALWEDVDIAAAEKGLAVVGGTVNQTGVGGLTLGGGYGYLSGLYGLAIDNLLSVEIVLANGQIATASKKENPGLFWAVRGAGAGFGVVTSFVFRAHEQKNLVWGGMLAFSPSHLKTIIEFANQTMEKSKGEATIMVGFTSPPPADEPCVVSVVFYNGPEADGKSFFQPLLNLKPVLDGTGPILYPEINAVHNPFIPMGTRRTMKGSAFTYPINPDFVQETYGEYVKLLTERPGAAKTLTLFEFIKYDKIIEVPTSDMAFANRGPYGNVVFATAWKEKKDDEAMRDWTRRMANRSKELLHKSSEWKSGVGEYANYDGLNESRTKDLFGANYEKLLELKRQFDPYNAFNMAYDLVPERDQENGGIYV